MAQVFYPGLTTHPGHDLAAARTAGRLVWRDALACGWPMIRWRPSEAFIQRTKLFPLAPSLAGVRFVVLATRAGHLAPRPHAGQRAAVGITPGVLRLSVGIEEVAELAGGPGTRAGGRVGRSRAAGAASESLMRRRYSTAE
ncbi:MAG: PLP-dependent transferase [Hymenobacter sp.]